MADVLGRVFNIQRFSTEDGPGIRTTVFLKGCPLRCLWCANPESQAAEPQLVRRLSSCIGCGRCASSCPSGAIDAQLALDRVRCNACGECVSACPSGALSFYGVTRSVGEVFETVLRDAGCYANSGGGLTVSGGEPMLQPDFVAALFERACSAGIHTALDTCGYCDTELFERVLPLTGLILFDLKLMDPEKHREYTGVDNAVILKNAAWLAKKGAAMRIRIPLIPGINDSDENLEATAGFVAGFGSDCPVDLLPYHKFGLNKYGMLGMDYQLGGARPPKMEEKLRCQAVFRRHGLNCEIH